MPAKRILIVEDDHDIVEGMRTLLEGAGYAVVSAGDGIEALARLRTERSLALILLDLRMPNMTGYEFRTRQLKDPALAQVPVVVVTADSAAHVEANGLGAATVLTKPFCNDALLTAVRSYAV